MASACVSFTACDDDDPVDEPVYVIGGDKNDTPDIEFSQTDVRVKIGEANRIAIPIASATGEVKAFSLNPEVAEVVMVDGTPMIEGLKNGMAGIMVSDANNNYKKLQVSVYTTDQMELSHSNFEFKTPLGSSATTKEAKVILGNGGYSVTSDNTAVKATVDAETGVLSITATSKVDPYTATLTVKDASGLAATITVTVVATFDPFTPEQLTEILNQTESMIWADCKDPSDGNQPYYFGWRDYGYGAWLDTTDNGNRTVGWWCESWGSDYGGIKITYPANAAVNAEVDGTLYFQYSYIQWYSLYEYPGKAKVLENSDTQLVVICWQVDEVNQRINRGYVVIKK